MKFQKSIALALGLAALVSAPLAASTDKYSFDGNHSSIGFDALHLGIFKVHGTFDKFDAVLDYDAKDVTKSDVKVTIDIASINTRNEMRDKHLRSEDFFNAASFTTGTFTSTKVEAGKDGKLKITGDLTLRGVTKSVVLDAAILGTAVDDYGNNRLGFTASTTINRMDYGIAWNHIHKSGAITVGPNIDIVISGEAIQAKAPAADDKSEKKAKSDKK